MRKKIPLPVCPVGVKALHCKTLAAMPEVEHIMFVVYAGVEVIHLPATFWWVNVVLLVSGAGGFIWRRVTTLPYEEAQEK